MEWRAAWARCGPTATEAEVTAVHLGAPRGTTCTARDMEVARLHWLRLGRVPTLALARSVLPQCPTAALTRRYPASVPPLPPVPPGWCTDVVLGSAPPGPGMLELLCDVPLIRHVHVVRAEPLPVSHAKLRWHRPTAAPGSLGLELALRPLPANVSVLLLEPQRLYHPLLVPLLLRASQRQGSRTLLSTTAPPTLAGGLFFWPSALGTGRRWSRLLSQMQALPPTYVAEHWRGPVGLAEEETLLPRLLVSRTLAWEAAPDDVPLPAAAIDEAEAAAETAAEAADVPPAAVLLAMRLAFPFCRQVWVEDGWAHAAAVFGSAATVTSAPAPTPGAVLVAHGRKHPQWTGHQLVLGDDDDSASVRLGRIGIYVDEDAAPLRHTLLQGVCSTAPEWKWRGWLYPHRLEGWLRLVPLLRAHPAPVLAALGPVRHEHGSDEPLPLLDELAHALPALTVVREVTPACTMIYAPTWSLLPAEHGATWVLVDEPPHAGLPPRTVHLARLHQTLVGPPLLPLEPLSPEWQIRGALHPATVRHLRTLARQAPDEVRAIVPLPFDHPETDRWLDERVHGEAHGGPSDSSAGFDAGLFRCSGTTVHVCPSA